MAATAGFTADEAIEFLALTLASDKERMVTDLATWMEDHILNPRDGYVLLFTLATAAALVLGNQPDDDEFIGYTAESLDGTEVPWHMTIIGQLLGAAANEDTVMLGAICGSVVNQADPETSLRALMDVVAPLLGIFRSACEAERAS